MLVHLEIRDIVLVERLALDLPSGLTVLTGETGAGKSILLDALGFATGRKVRRDLVRTGAGEGSVTAVFELPGGHPAGELLAEAGLGEADVRELVLRRTASETGPSRAFVNDRRVSADALARIGATLVEVHGQHDDRGLLDPRAHRPLLDAFAGLDLGPVRAAWRTAREAADRRDAAREALVRAAEDADYLRHATDELARLDPAPGEADRLDAERRLSQAAERIREEVSKAAAEIGGQGAEGLMATASSRLARAAEKGGDEAAALLDPALAALDRAMIELGEADAAVAAALESLATDPGRLEAVEERLFAIRALARKHDVLPDDLADLRVEMAARLDAIDTAGDRIAEAERAADAARADYEAAASAVSEARREAGRELDRRVTDELAPLRMEAARFVTEIAPGEPGPDGQDRVSFTATINPGLAPGAIDRIASGGELSRFLLALKVCLSARVRGRVMVFDEIDRGVGGATADAVGRRLARLAEDAQVLVVTHSPQVAAMGTRHLSIRKSSAGGVTRTDVTPLDGEARDEEIARMLAGDEITPEAREAARALIAKAG